MDLLSACRNDTKFYMISPFSLQSGAQTYSQCCWLVLVDAFHWQLACP
uniref:Uncharacterized protein n=1 Tax=Arundo donax TaxID=35708 RepID=A0A0A8Y0V3_ARUDO